MSGISVPSSNIICYPLNVVRMPRGQSVTYTDNIISREFIAQHGEDIRYLPKLGWMQWAGTRRRTIDTVCVVEMARALCADIVAAEEKNLTAKEERDIGSKARAAAVEALARGDPGIFLEIECLDAGPRMGTPSKTLALE